MDRSCAAIGASGKVDVIDVGDCGGAHGLNLLYALVAVKVAGLHARKTVPSLVLPMSHVLFPDIIL